MDAVSLFLIATAAVLLLGVLGEVVFQRTGIPQPLWLAACGLLLGPTLGIVPRDDLAQLSLYVALPVLVVVIAELGGRLNAQTAIRGVARAGPLAALSFLGSVFIVALTCHLAALVGVLPEDWGLAQSLLLGLILGAPCSLIVTPAMIRARLAPVTTQALELAASLAGAASVLFVALLVAAMEPDGTGFVDSLVNVLVSASVGVGLGLVGAALWFGFLYALQAPSYAYAATLAALMVLYVVAEELGASGAVSILVCSMALANAPSLAKALGLPRPVEIGNETRGHRRLIMLFVRASFFLFLGLLLGPPWGLLGLGVLLAFLLFPARLPAAFAATAWSGWDKHARPLAALSMPRGMLAGALALLPLRAGIEGASAMPLTVFTTIVVTICVYAITFPFARRRLPAADIVAFDVDAEIGASPVSLVTPDENARRALMPSSTDETGQDALFGPLPPPVPPPRRDEDG